jgi:hypothetical protein
MKTMTMARRKRMQVNLSEATSSRARCRSDEVEKEVAEGRVESAPPGAARVDTGMLLGELAAVSAGLP